MVTAWNRFESQLTRGKRWEQIGKGLGRGVLALMPVECNSFIHRGMKTADVPIFIKLVKQIDPGAIVLGREIEGKLKQGLADLRT